MTITIRELLARAPDLAAAVRVAGDPGTAIEQVTFDSRSVTPGTLFVALRGAAHDGHRFISSALDRGAVALLCEESPADNRVECALIAEDSRAALARLARAYYDDPSRALGLVGVTGTKGKTTTSFLLESLLAGCYETGLIGTVDLKVGPRRWRNPAHQTTPESLDVQRLLREMVAAGVTWAVLETSSHALVTHRVDGCAYDIAVITNITHEHLDFHGTYERYRAAKASLFDRLGQAVEKSPARPRGAVINRDDPGAASLLPDLPDVSALTYGLSAESDVRGEAIVSSGDGLSFTLRSPWGDAALTLPLLGRFNLYNALAAATAALLAGVPLAVIAARLAKFSGVPGRLQALDLGQPFRVIVDYAHNPDSLAQVLQLVREVTPAPGRLIALFGSGGERDVAKRPLMGRVCAELADFGIFTNEDPRGEEPLTILQQIAAGAAERGWREGADYALIADRRAAIAAAYQLARPGDTVVLAGKGHENSIIYADHVVPWDEATEARQALVALGYQGKE